MAKVITITYEQLRTLLHYQLDKTMDTCELMVNASPSQPDDGSMIQHWMKETGIELEGKEWRCPMCGDATPYEKLDGAHVVYPDGENSPQFITPLCQHCNRKRSAIPFFVCKEHLVSALQDR